MEPRDRPRPGEGNEHGGQVGGLGLRPHTGPHLAAALSTLAACLALAFGLGAAQADQLPDLPPPPAPSDADPGGDGSAAGYPDATTNQAEQLFTSEFSNTVDSLTAAQPDLGPNPDFLNDHTALVSAGQSPAELKDQIEQILAQNQGDPEAARSQIQDLLDAQNSGAPKLVSSTLPLRAPSDGGGQAPVDLSLDAQNGGYVPANPLVDLKLPDNATNDVAVGDQGIKVDLGATANSSADPITGGDNLFYHEAATDTDLVLVPLSVGFETLYQLRSPQSPEHLEMSFTLPAGASLEDASGDGAEIVKEGQTLGTVSAPSAVDAAGNPVAVSTSVSGDSLELDVHHQDPNVAYPINVDPVTDVYTGSNGGINAFSADWTSGQTTGSAYTLGTSCTQNVSCTSGTSGPRGLYIHAPTNQTYAAGQAASWVYFTPHWPTTTAYISSLSLGPMDYNRHAGTATNPYLAAGILSSQNLSWLSSMTQTADMASTYWVMGPTSQQAPNAKIAVFQLYTPSSVSLTHWRHAFLSGAQMTLADTDNPTVSVDTGPLTSGWLDGKQTTAFQVPASDGGLGVSSILAPGPDGYDWTQFPSAASPCVGTHASPCPSSATASAGYYPNQVAEGQSQTLAFAWDALGKVTIQSWNVRVDSSPPQISTSGGLAQQTSDDQYTLHIDASDGSTNDPANWRSGVRRIQVFVNGNQVADSGQQSCSAQAGSCPLSLDYTPDPSSFTTDQLHFKVMVTDELGHTSSKEWDTTLDTSPPHIQLSDDLYDSRQQAITDEFTNLHVHVTDDPASPGGWQSGVQNLRILLDGEEQDHYTQDCPEGSCPEDADWELYAPDQSPGDHMVTVIATDQRGQQSQESFTVTVGTITHWDPLPAAGDTVPVATSDGDTVRCADGEMLTVRIDGGPPPDPDPADLTSEDDNADVPTDSPEEVLDPSPPVQPRCGPDGQASSPPTWTAVPGETATDVQSDSAPALVQDSPRTLEDSVWWGPIGPGTANPECVWSFAEVAYGNYGKGFVRSKTSNKGGTYEASCLNDYFNKRRHQIAVSWNLLVHKRGKWRFCVGSGWAYNPRTMAGYGIYWNFNSVRCGHGRHANRTKSYIYFPRLHDWKGGSIRSPGEYWPKPG
jgi:hypothetical protein